MSRRKEITAQMLEDMFIDAMGGDTEAEREYRKAVRTLAKRANQQFRQIEKSGVESESYKRAQAYLGDRTRFKEHLSSVDILSIRNDADELLSYINARDYSISQARQSAEDIEHIRNALEKTGVDTTDRWVAYNISELFKTQAWKEYRKAHGKSTNLIRAAADQFAQGKSVDDLIDAYNDYSSGREGAPDLIESFELFAPDSW